MFERAVQGARNEVGAVHFTTKCGAWCRRRRVRSMAAMLKAIHASEDREAVRAKAAQVVTKLIEM